VFRDDASLASLYRAYWDYMWKLATPIDQPYQAPSSFGAPPSDPAPSVSFNGGTWPRVIFSPQGGTEARLIDAINHCHATLDVAIFSLYSQPVADAVLAARARGVTVRVIADASQARRSAAVGSLVAQGVDLRLSAGRGGAWGVTHHKFAVFDGRMVATGSYNFSQNAEQFNFENQFFSADGGDAAAFEGEFAAVWAQAHAPASGDVPAAGVALR
jgi:phosphatidylserine/phosphatidylglycerophosphate/cardiolipin synthase-like enzyme